MAVRNCIADLKDISALLSALHVRLRALQTDSTDSAAQLYYLATNIFEKDLKAEPLDSQVLRVAKKRISAYLLKVPKSHKSKQQGRILLCLTALTAF